MRVTAYQRDFNPPQDTRSSNTAKLWDRVVSCCFVVCLVLFSRAFFFATPGGRLLNSPLPSSTTPTLASRFNPKGVLLNSTFEDLFHNESLPCCDPAMAGNLTTGPGISYPLEDQPPALSNSHAMGGQVTAVSIATSTTNDLIGPENARRHLPADSSSAREVASHSSMSAMHREDRGEEAVYLGSGLRVTTSAAGYEDIQQEPFFAMEEFDDMGQTFALKIWLDSGDRSKMGRVEFCQASSGVRRSRSPRRRQRDNDFDYDRNTLGKGERGTLNRETDRDYDRRYGSSARDTDRAYQRPREDDEPRSYNSRRNQDYRERDRERERERDRGRYDGRARDGDYGSSSRRQGRSASPQSRDKGSRSDSPVDKAKPNFAPSGLLAAETNTVKAADGTSTVLKYNEPPEARKPLLGWRLYVFKDSQQTELLHIHRQSAYLVGRDRLVADIALDHPSCSKQHAAIQYRYVQEKDEFGGSKGTVKPFVIDLESTNGTIVNDETIPAARYYELKAGDVIKFGLSTKEYVLLHDEAS
ncbi:hypothetical protein NLJ89_g8906 [Agrocybe chaxingu]|uniref:FHA domain-containing protein n=1 Tax=Agrocybe chaxingu TaxID=84603 RepID=A0A9W8MQD1_9AGAR|nr:hypothetical protein NLJ89_g8906 [Agrocybe chaxingu]